ncbi:MAG: hypothetical protein HQK55_15100, partial [Deltaproteobacteria bacterium]|nr:hypothetical protein [Deltaproteobacteria bacterium]
MAWPAADQSIGPLPERGMSKYHHLFPYFGGKSKVALEVWKRLGNGP